MSLEKGGGSPFFRGEKRKGALGKSEMSFTRHDFPHFGVCRNFFAHSTKKWDSVPKHITKPIACQLRKEEDMSFAPAAAAAASSTLAVAASKTLTELGNGKVNCHPVLQMLHSDSS